MIITKVFNLFAFLFLISLVLCFQIPKPNQLSPKSLQASYNREKSINYATWASIAFCPKQCIQGWNCQSGSSYQKLVNVSYIDNTITKAAGYVGYDPTTETIVTSWRGSNNYQNWIEDFVFNMQVYSACSDCYVHTGFWTDYKSNEKKLLTAVQNIMKNYRVSKILCTGHSLGAALSFIIGVQFAQKFPTVSVEVHNFGQPRVGNHKFSTFAETKLGSIFRVVHNRDIVPHLPPEVDYHHSAFEVLLSLDCSTYKVCDKSGQDSSCSNRFFPNYDPNDHDFYFINISHVKC